MTQLGRYELFERLGRGGFEIVYRVRDTALNVERAVKVQHPALVADPDKHLSLRILNNHYHPICIPRRQICGLSRQKAISRKRIRWSVR